MTAGFQLEVLSFLSLLEKQAFSLETWVFTFMEDLSLGAPLDFLLDLRHGLNFRIQVIAVLQWDLDHFSSGDHCLQAETQSKNSSFLSNIFKAMVL